MDTINWNDEIKKRLKKYTGDDVDVKINHLITNKNKSENILKFCNEQTEELCIKIVQKYQKMLIFVKPENQTNQFINICVLNKFFLMNYCYLLKYLCQIVKTQEFYNTMFKIHSYSIKYIPTEFISTDIINNLYISKEHELYEYIPNDNTYDYYFNQIIYGKISYDKVPSNILSKEFVNKTITKVFSDNLGKYFTNIDYTIPSEYIDKKLCMLLLNNRCKFKIPIELQTFDIMLYACTMTSVKIQDISTDLENLELLYMAVLVYNPFQIKNVPETLLTEQLLMVFISNYCRHRLDLYKILNLIPEKYHTKKIFKFIILNDYRFICHVKNNIYELFDNLIEKEINECLVCNLNKEYFIAFDCNHLICTDCIKHHSKCYYKCLGNINTDECFKNLNYIKN